MAGGADDEVTLRRNTDAFNDYALMPNYLTDVSSPDTRTRVLGCDLDWPLIIAPTGMNRLFHHDAEPAVARAAGRSGIMYTLSTMATTSLEDIAAETSGPNMFQVYILRDRGLTREFVSRCKDAGYSALCLTVDTVVAGNRERDLVHGLRMPPRFTLKALASFAVHLDWTFNLLRYRNFDLANIGDRPEALKGSTTSVIEYINDQFDNTISWDDAAWLAEEWGGPFVIKGIHSVHDALQAKSIGASGVMISNHGGRQLDGVPAAINCLAPIRSAVGEQMELILDGGIRRGTHIAKALALGANAVSIGRPYLYGLAAGGEAGVDHALAILNTEFKRSMQLLGCSSIRSIGSEHVVSS